MAQPVKKAAMKIKRQFTLLDRETIGGLLLIIATIISIIIANSPFAHSYHDLMEKHFVMGIMDAYNLDLSIHHWVNDGLMVIFFLVAGLEMKREILVGELSSKQKAAMPLISAIGGMLVPAAIFIIFNAGEESSKGWAIPMATDIAYALGIMGLLEKRIPVQLKIFLVALAIADDVGAILVIAFFYSSEIAWGYLAVAAGLYGVMTVMNLRGVKALSWYLLFGLGFWLCFLYSGIHATIAGVLFAVVIPVMPRFSTNLFWKKVETFKSRFNEERNKELNPLV
ncbi:MAG: Na+/H+ antiporter NhaA, partial [Marinoscillum sp.]